MNILAALSDAERDVVEELIDGGTNKQLSKRLRISDKTVKNHISHILKKVGCRSRLDLTVLVYKARLQDMQQRLNDATRSKPGKLRRAA